MRLIKKVRFLVYVIITITVLAQGCNNSSKQSSYESNLEHEVKDITVKIGDRVGEEIGSAAKDIAEVVEDKISDNISSDQSSNSSDPSSLEKAEYIRTVDGDTIVVNYKGEEQKVRMLTVNCEESVHRDESKNNEYGKLSSSFTKDFFDETEYVYLQFDIKKEDKYGRLLAYVWIKNNDVDLDDPDDINNYMYNAIIINSGYATSSVYEPNHYYAEYLETLEENAKENSIGLWTYKGYRKLQKHQN